MSERLPYRATAGAAAYDGIDKLPVCVVLENIRSLYNVGAFFRTADAAGIEALHLCGCTGAPPKNEISKTALGAEETVRWDHTWNAATRVGELRERCYEIAAIETSAHAVDLFDWEPRFPVCLLFGHEVDGLSAEVAQMADVHVRIPMLGMKHSLNVATAGGVVMYELLRKYRCGARNPACRIDNRADAFGRVRNASTGVETSLDAARRIARATNHFSGAEDE